MHSLLPLKKSFYASRLLKQSKKQPTRNKTRHSFKFVSLLPPSHISNLTLVPSYNSQRKNNLIVKQSYLLFTWMSYIQTHASPKNLDASTNGVRGTRPRFFIHKKKTSRRTYTKAPMAHKTFSQEQFVYTTYSISASFASNFKNELTPSSINASVYTALRLRNTFVPFETNLFFLKKMTLSFSSQDVRFMQLW